MEACLSHIVCGPKRNMEIAFHPLNGIDGNKIGVRKLLHCWRIWVLQGPACRHSLHANRESKLKMNFLPDPYNITTIGLRDVIPSITLIGTCLKRSVGNCTLPFSNLC